jgi:zinc transport system substrate-binding protein
MARMTRTLRRITWLMAAVVAVSIAPGSIMPGSVAHAATKRQQVVASFYPLAYAAERVGGNRVEVANLTPAGAEPHDLELTPKQIDELLDADLVFDLGRNFQPAVEKAAEQRDGPTVKLLDVLPIKTGGKKVDESDADALDPHVWLDPVLMSAIVTQVQGALTKADPSGRAVYRRNADALRAQLTALDMRYASGLADCKRRVVVTSHEAFGYLARRYGLKQEGVAGLSPDAEPDPKRLADLTDLVKRDGVTVVFTEALVSPRIADTLAREAGVRTEVLDPLEGLTDAKQKRGATYTSVMDENLAKLRDALGCT